MTNRCNLDSQHNYIVTFNASLSLQPHLVPENTVVLFWKRKHSCVGSTQFLLKSKWFPRLVYQAHKPKADCVFFSLGSRHLPRQSYESLKFVQLGRRFHFPLSASLSFSLVVSIDLYIFIYITHQKNHPDSVSISHEFERRQGRISERIWG